MSEEISNNELETLKVIAETLNRSNDLKYMLQSVLEELLKVTGISTGWIFLAKERPTYTFMADHNLPPALSWDGKKPMCGGSCWCLDKFWGGRLQKAVNIINCKRLEDAVEFSWGDTKGITHHATVPLMAGDQMFGVLNVASPGKEHFTEEELTLLQSVAYQIGTAVKRTTLYQAERKRAELYSKLDEVSRDIWKMDDLDSLPEIVVERIGHTFAWPSVSFFINKGEQLQLRSVYSNGKSNTIPKYIPTSDVQGIINKINNGEKSISSEICNFSPYKKHPMVVMPLMIREELFGALVIHQDQQNKMDDSDIEVLKALSDHISLSIESIRLYEKRREITILEERNRLARDLHDSVNQKLFSLSLTARGVKEMMPKDNSLLVESMHDIQTLSQEALLEMRTMIWQLRPPGLEDGVVTALRNYGTGLRLKIKDNVSGVSELPRSVEEALWRIGQEALNNVKKHSQINEAEIELIIKEDQVVLSISDQGCGFTVNKEDANNGKWSIGLSSMEERAELIGGQLSIKSKLGEGTCVTVTFPIGKNYRTK